MAVTSTRMNHVIRARDQWRGNVYAQNEPLRSRDIPPQQKVDLPRAASYTYMGDAKGKEQGNNSLVTIKGAFPDSDLIAHADDVADLSPPDSSGVSTPEEKALEFGTPAHETRDLVAELRKSYKVRGHKSAEEPEDGTKSSASSIIDYRQSTDSLASACSAATAPVISKPRASLSSNFSRKLNRRSWVGSQPSTPPRSISPPKKEADATIHEINADGTTPPNIQLAKRRKSLVRRRQSKLNNDAAQNSDEQSDQSSNRNSTLLRKRSSRPVSGLFRTQSSNENEKSTPSKSTRPPMPSLPKSFSTDKLPTLNSPPLSPNIAAPMPRLLPADRKASSNLVLPRKKDELWGVFRTLDGDFAKFMSKTLAFKANVVRSSLLPFLRQYATHPSNQILRPEDLDRRANILNKWWTGLIELLHGRNNQSISGTDRPAILEAASGIMERPEWRLPSSPFCGLSQRKKAMASRNQSNTSLTSESSDFLVESVHHNVRNIFIRNLTAQMAFVVDKMSLRHASASLVTFCGKACAFAFMFVPGMADVLVRLWDLQAEPLRRVLEGVGIGKFENLTDLADAIVPEFPPALHPLAFSSLFKYMRKLRTPPALPLGTGHIPWWGHWIERWRGRDSDLFYVFVKHFHILVTDFLPPGSSPRERMCAPGLLMVHAQILTNLDATIYRDANQGQNDIAGTNPASTFDDVLADPDAVASTLPIPPTNATRLMAENRLIMLIRDFLSGRTEYPAARQLFAASFNDLLQAAVRGISMFDHAACYTLLDFLEEALVLLVRFEHHKDGESSLIDFDFWMLVWRKMIGSQNTMTEIRLYAFLHTVWNSVVCELDKKTDICNGLLLDPEIFGSRFNHWCPMVRAYFMRLLCWRVGRYDGDSPHSHVQLLEAMRERLQTTWSHYLYLREKAEQQRSLPPPTNPCNPAPCRRLLIIRTDPQASSARTFLSFDGIVPAKPSTNGTSPASKRASMISQIELDPRPESSMSTMSSADSEVEPRGRGLGGFFRNLIASKSRTSSETRARSSTRQGPSPEKTDGIVRAATEDLQNLRKAGDSAPQAPQVTQILNFSFKFSLEYQPNAKPLAPMRLLPPRLPLPAQQLLQTYSQNVDLQRFMLPIEPRGESRAYARYCGRALAEWTVVLGECQSFFERRKFEGMPSNKFVETPMLGVEVFKRPG